MPDATALRRAGLTGGTRLRAGKPVNAAFLAFPSVGYPSQTLRKSAATLSI
jgi:hypothetical protein